MDNRCIGVFDSGIGGLTMVREMMKLMPNEKVVYFGDTGRVPYGSKSDETVKKYAESDIKFLLQFNLKMVVAACGTVSAIALPSIYNNYDIPVLGVTSAAASAAALLSQSGRIGVIGTQSTINSDCYAKLIKKHIPDAFVTSVSCPLFVPLVENGYTNKEATLLIAKEYLEPIKKEKVDTLIMGCTHYPHLEKVIKTVMGEDVALVNPSFETAKIIKNYLKENDLLAEEQDDEKYRFFVSDDATSFARLGSTFLGKTISGKVEKIDIERYV